MKRLLVPILLVALASPATAELYITVDGAIDPEAVNLFTGQHAVIGIHGEGFTPLSVYFLGVSAGDPGALDGTDAEMLYIGHCSFVTSFDDPDIAAILGIYNPFINFALCSLDLAGGPPRLGLLVDEIDFECTGAGDVTLMLFNGDGDLMDTQLIHQMDDHRVAHWKFDEGSGSLTSDSVGDNHGTIYGAQWANGVLDGALDFNGVDDYVDCGGHNSLNLGEENFSISAWINVRSTLPDTAQGIISKWQDQDNTWYLYTYDDSVGFTSKSQGLWAYATITGSFLDYDRWYHVCFVADRDGFLIGERGKIYINGEKTASLHIYSPISSDNNASVKIGYNANPDTPGYFDGLIDDVRIFKRALTAEDVNELYRDGIGLVAHWTFNEANGSIAHDTSGGEHDGTIHGADWTSGYLFGGALNFDGVNDYVSVPYDYDLKSSSFTVAVWVYIDFDPREYGGTIFSQIENQIEYISSYRLGLKFALSPTEGYGLYVAYRDQNLSYRSYPSNFYPKQNVWTHLCATRDSNGLISLYADGELVKTWASTAEPGYCSQNFTIGAYGLKKWSVSMSSFFRGMIDDVLIYSKALSAEAVRDLSKNPDVFRDGHIDSFDFALLAAQWLGEPNIPSADILRDGIIDELDLRILADRWLECYIGKAENPEPSYNQITVSVNPRLQWSEGMHALAHDVYLGTDANAVTDANRSSPEFIGATQDTFFDPCTLDFETTYYWRIDETRPGCVEKGDKWTFTSGTALAHTPTPEDKTNVADLAPTLSWIAGSDGMSYNLYFGTDQNAVAYANTASPEYKATQTTTSYTLEGLHNDTTYYWRIDTVNGGIHKGNVWSFTTRCFADPPTPADGGYFANLNPTLSWIANCEGMSYDVYFGTDQNAVAYANTASPEYKATQTTTSYTLEGLHNDTTYYWRIDTVNGGIHKGNVWSFTTSLFPNLIGWWQFGETIGNIAIDSSGFGNNGTIFNASWLDDPNRGWCLDFDGDGDRVEIPDSDILTPPYEITISFWLYNRGGQNAGIYKFASCPNENASPGNSRAYYVAVGGTGSVTFRIHSSRDVYDSITGNDPVGLDQWHHIAVTFNSGSAAIYIDGEPDNSETLSVSSIMNDHHPLIIGGYYEYCGTDSFVSRLNGRIDDVMIFNRALTAEEIAYLEENGL